MTESEVAALRPGDVLRYDSIVCQGGTYWILLEIWRIANTSASIKCIYGAYVGSDIYLPTIKSFDNFSIVKLEEVP